MARKDTDLPFGDAFSPAQLETGDEEELVAVLNLIESHEGDPQRFDEAVREQFFSSLDRAKNVRLGVGPAGYKIVDGDLYFTDIGEELYSLRDSPEELYDRFAQHILRNLHGLKGLEIVEDLRAQGKSPTNDALKREFQDQYNFHIDGTSNHWSQIRAWLSKADVVNTGTHQYDIDRTRIEELIGLGSEDILQLARLNEQQQAFLRALALVDPNKPIRNSRVRRLAERAYDVDISQSNISRRTLNPLQEAGFIEWEHVDGKPNRVQTTEKFDAEVLKPVLDDLADRTGVPRDVLRLSFKEILENLDHDSTHKRGVALETLAIKTGRLLGLTFAGWHVRGQDTGGDEVTVVFDEVDELFNRVQVRCDNTTSTIKPKHVAREVGICRTLQTNTILMIGLGGISEEARQYANRVMQNENIAIMFLTSDDLQEIDHDPTHLLNVLRGESRWIGKLKSLGESEYIDKDDDETSRTEREEKALDEFLDNAPQDARGEDDASLSDFN